MSLDSVTEYALSFSGDAVHLQQRERAGLAVARDSLPAWRPLGSVDFDDPAFRDALIQLRMMATGSDTDADLPVTLVIPDDQILYTTLTVVPSADREHAVGRALDGLTPYAINDLAFDWEGDGDSVRVAAVARQTLREARDFAAQYGFSGVSYCADPESALFPGAPIFVLDTPTPQRAAVDPALAGVTAAALMFKDEPETATLADAPDFTPPELTPPELSPPVRHSAAQLELPAEAPAEAQPEAAAPEPAQTTSEPDTKAAADEMSADSDALTDIGTPLVPDDVVPKAETNDTPPEAVASAVAASQPPPVVHPAPDVARDPQPIPQAQQAEAVPQQMNPRARAVHNRAADARQARQPGAAPSAPPRSAPGHRGGLAGLIGMLGALVLGLVLIWAFAVPGRQSEPVISAADQTPVGAPVVTKPIVNEPAIPAAEISPVPVPATQADIPPVAISPAAAPRAETAPDVSSRRALTEDEARRVVIAAAAVAAAVVPPTEAARRVPAATISATAAAAGPTVEAPAVAGPAVAGPVGAAQPLAATPPVVKAPTVTAATTTPAKPTPAKPAPAVTQPRPATAAPVRAAPVASTAPRASTVSQLTSSARPQLAPRRSTPQTSVPRADAAPTVPANPLPYAAASQSAAPSSRSARPPARNRAVVQPAAAPQAAARQPVVQPAQTERASTSPQSSSRARPPQRPEGAAPELIDSSDQGAALDRAEQDQLGALIRDLQRYGLAQAVPLGEIGAVLLAEARPVRKPANAATATDAVSPGAVQNALRSASSSPPDRPATSRDAAATPARDSGGLLRGSARPAPKRSKTGVGAGSAVPVMTQSSVDKAIASAVDASPATPGGVQLSVLSSSPVPPRRGDSAPAAAPPKVEAPVTAPVISAVAPVAAAVARTPGPNEAEMAARRALDEQLQSQAEARIRARAQADAAAEAQARAAAESRARAQAAAEERAARASKQAYKPPEIDDEPEVATSAARGGATTATVAKAATESRSIDLGRTTIIGIIGAGKASRALIRLRSGKIVTVRLGDRIDGGTINSIGDGRLTYVKAGKTRELRLLDGR